MRVHNEFILGGRDGDIVYIALKTKAIVDDTQVMFENVIKNNVDEKAPTYNLIYNEEELIYKDLSTTIKASLCKNGNIVIAVWDKYQTYYDRVVKTSKYDPDREFEILYKVLMEEVKKVRELN